MGAASVTRTRRTSSAGVGGRPDGLDVGTPEQREAPRRDVVHVGDPLGDVRAVGEQHVGHAAQRLVHVDHVGALGVLDAVGRERGLRAGHLDAVRDELVDERRGVGHRALRPVDRDHVGARELGRVDVGLVPDVGPLVRLGHARRIDVGRHGHEGFARGAATEDLDLVVEQHVGVLGHVVDRRLDHDTRDLDVDLRIGLVGRLVVRAPEGKLDRVRDGALICHVLRREDRGPVIPARPDVAVGDLDLAGVLERRAAVVGEVRVARDVRAHDGLLDLERRGVGVRQEQVVLVVLSVRRTAGLDLQHARVAVQVDEERRLDHAREVADDARLGRRARDHVAVDVEPVGVRALSERSAVGVVRHGEVETVVLQDVAHLGPRRRGEVLDVVQHRIGALPLVAVDVRVEPDRHLVLVHERLVLRRRDRVGLDELAPRGLLGGLGLRLLAVSVTRWMSRPSVDCPTTWAEMRSLCAMSVLRNGAISSYGVTPRAIEASVGSSGTVGRSGCDG